MILNKKPSVVGFYKLVMKEGSDNMRDSAVKDIINQEYQIMLKFLYYCLSLFEICSFYLRPIL